MSTYAWPNGIGASLGDSLVTCKPLMTTGDVWFLSSVTGNDSNNGRDEAKPLATLAQAYTNASSDDIIVCLSGHTETLTGAQALAKSGLVIVGTGLSGGLPTVKFQLNAAAASMFTPSASGVQLRNIWIKGNAQACSTARIAVTGGEFQMRSCYVECDQFDTGAAVSLGSGADHANFRGTTFINIATVTQPESALKATAAIADLRLDGAIFDAGTLGFSNFYAVDLSAALTTRFHGESVTLKNGADIKVNASSTGYFNAATVTTSGRINW